MVGHHQLCTILIKQKKKEEYGRDISLADAQIHWGAKLNRVPKIKKDKIPLCLAMTLDLGYQVWQKQQGYHNITGRRADSLGRKLIAKKM